jgi:L-histidine Nalpha-methyltransferase
VILHENQFSLDKSGSEHAVAVLIHPNQFPQAVEAAFRESLRTRQMNHKFHYDTPKQTLRWLRVHETFSPARQDPSCLNAYQELAAALATAVAGEPAVDIVSLGCGGGQKEAQLIRVLRAANRSQRLRFVSADVSVGLTLLAREAAVAAGVEPEQCVPFVMDLALVSDLRQALGSSLQPGRRRVVSFFGMLPNFPPGVVMPQLAGLLGPQDLLLLSANLAPGPDYAAGVTGVLPQYDNALTRDWLLSVLLDLGVERNHGCLEFQVAPCPKNSGLLRIEADFVFATAVEIQYGGTAWHFAGGDRFQLFYSYRYTQVSVASLLGPHGIQISRSWTNASGEEGVFLGHRTAAGLKPLTLP